MKTTDRSTARPAPPGITTDDGLQPSGGHGACTYVALLVALVLGDPAFIAMAFLAGQQVRDVLHTLDRLRSAGADARAGAATRRR